MDVDGVRQLRERRINDQFETKLNQLALKIQDIGKSCTNRMNRIDDLDRMCARLEATKLASQTQNSNRLSSSSHMHYGHPQTRHMPRIVHNAARSQLV